MNDLDGMRNPEEDLEHAHMLLAQMSPEELLKATYALEEIVEQSPRFRAKLDEAATGPVVSMDELLVEYGVTMNDLEVSSETPLQHDKAA